MHKLAIVGSHEDTRNNAPFDDLDYDIWVMNEAPQYDWCKRWTADIQMHKREVYRSTNNFVRSDHWAWLQQGHGEKVIWMQDNDDLVPNSRRYPLDEIIATIPGANIHKWLKPTIDHYPDRKTWVDLSMVYALVLAIYQGYEHIECYGMDLKSGTEYLYQIGNWRFWVGVALGMGMHLEIHCSPDDFGTGRLYGYDGEIQIDRAYFQGRVNDWDVLWKKEDWTLKKYKTRIDDVFTSRVYAKLRDMFPVYIDAAIAAGEMAGALHEAEQFANRQEDDLIPRQEFERRAAEAERDLEQKRKDCFHAGGVLEYVWNVLVKTNSYDALNQVRQFLGVQGQLAYEMGALLGKIRENKHYLIEYDNRLTAAGGIKTLEALAGGVS